MRLILSSIIVGFLFVWALDNHPDVIGYLIVGLFITLVLKALKK